MCVLRVTGTHFTPDAFLKHSTMRVCARFRAGEPRRRTKPDGPKHGRSGFTVVVSDAGWEDLGSQVADACSFIDRFSSELVALTQLDGVEEMALDFPLRAKGASDNVVAQFCRFPAALTRKAGAHGLSLEVSLYAISEDDHLEAGQETSSDAPRVLFVDVDDTLVRSAGSKRIPMTPVIARVRELHAAGLRLYCWSTGGAEYAQASARELGLIECFSGFLPKPNGLIDDQKFGDWRGVVTLHPNVATSMSLDEILSTLRGGAG